jgi:hypothetical protein
LKRNRSSQKEGLLHFSPVVTFSREVPLSRPVPLFLFPFLLPKYQLDPSVLIAEGPEHQGDTELVLSQTGYKEYLRGDKARFV